MSLYADYTDITGLLFDKLDKKRFLHTLGVAGTAACIAMSQGYDIRKAYLAGLLHDCAKYMDDSEYVEYCERHDIDMEDVEVSNPGLLHAKVGAYQAHKKYGIVDGDVLAAIRWHTTGRPGMSELEAIVFLADYIEPGRSHDPDLPAIRKEAFEDINQAIYHVYRNTMMYLRDSDKILDPTTEMAYRYYEDKVSNLD
ncbi:MAG: bis(5'-nucleosyl)-tetraphosphatase (symmetrical) YqeK [Lachnospiraceae bacterium]|nr:bis(5'-nucleosyl)-tetraphosphatase (symmetrical) YqeK [Lachnospiraceae bacterium]